MFVAEEDHALALLLSLDGLEFQFARDYVVKIAARETGVSKERPHGIKYSMTLHDLAGRRIYGIDNAHAVRGRTEYDHRHVHGAKKIVSYEYRGVAELLHDFYHEVERILRERGVQ